jgi:hypothetical protein
MQDQLDQLDQPATADLTRATSIVQMAELEQYPPETYACVLSETIRTTNVSLDAQRERLAQLAQIANGLAGDQTTANELGGHAVVLESLFHLFARQAAEALKSSSPRAPEAAEKFLTAALKSQKAMMAVLGAIKVLRDQHSSPTRAIDQPTPAFTQAT